MMIVNLCVVEEVGNEYGNPFVFEKDGRFFFGIECAAWHGKSIKEVSSHFFHAFTSEFKDSPSSYSTASAKEYLQEYFDEDALEKAMA